MSNTTSGGFAKPFLMQVATKGEIEKCSAPFLLGRYNGAPGEDISSFALENRGCNYDFFWKERKTGAIQSGWPLRVREGGYVAIPDLPENHAILKKMAERKWSVRVPTASGHIEKTVDHPPLYALVAEEVTQVSPEAILDAIANNPEIRTRLLALLTETPAASTTAPSFTLDTTRTREEIEADIAAASAVLDNPESTKAEKKVAGDSKRAAEAELTALV